MVRELEVDHAPGNYGSVSGWEPFFDANWDALWQAQPNNVLLVKFSCWFSP